MKMNTAVRLLQMLPVRKDQAISVAELATRWYSRKCTRDEARNIQRYLNELANDREDGPALVEITTDSPRRFYLKLTKVASWFMTEEVALNLLLTNQVIGPPLASFNAMDAKQMMVVAEKIVGASTETRRVRERVRIVPDGFGRLPALIDHGVLHATLDSVIQQRQLNFTYVSSKGRESSHLVSPQGLVAKDGTIYLLATKGLSDRPGHFPLHRMSNAVVDHRALQPRPDFDLDRYILESNQLSHTIDPEAAPLRLELWVAPETLYHFKERPVSGDQTFGPVREADGWTSVTATVMFTQLLVPFLLSMGGWIEVVGPPSVRDEMAERVRAMAAHYPPESLP